MSATPKQRVLAVDFGDRRTGLAATDYTGTIPVRLPTLEGLADGPCADAIAAVAVERQTEVIVVGMPLLLSGEAGARAQRTEAFRALLERRAPCPVTSVDESHSTDEAHARLKGGGMKAARRRAHADSVAAVVILERYLAERGRG